MEITVTNPLTGTEEIIELNISTSLLVAQDGRKTLYVSASGQKVVEEPTIVE